MDQSSRDDAMHRLRKATTCKKGGVIGQEKLVLLVDSVGVPAVLRTLPDDANVAYMNTILGRIHRKYDLQEEDYAKMIEYIALNTRGGETPKERQEIYNKGLGMAKRRGEIDGYRAAEGLRHQVF